jgi:hypothetical protein
MLTGLIVADAWILLIVLVLCVCSAAGRADAANHRAQISR